MKKGNLYRVGEWEVDPSTSMITNNDQTINLEPKVMDLLVFMAQNPDEVYSRDELLEKVWNGVIVSDESLTNAIIKLRKAFDDKAKNPKYIQTLPKKGYRLIAPVEKLSQSDFPENDLAITSSKIWSLKHTLLVIVTIIIVTTLWIELYKNNQSVSQTNAQSQHLIAKVDLSSVPTLAVLPFENMSQEAHQDYFVDGISEDIITDLSRISNLQVLGRNTTFQFKGQTIDPKQLGKDLKASHILEGSIRKSGSSLRITARLIDSKNGHQIWVERYDRQIDELFKIQDDVSRNIIKSLSVKLTSRDSELLGQTKAKNIEAYDLFLQGRWLMNERTKIANKQAQDIYRQAIKLDPLYSRPYGALAVAIIRSIISGWSTEVEEDKNRALNLALKATDLDNKSHTAYWSLAFTYLYRKQHNEAILSANQAMVNAPSFADGLALMAFINNYLGNAEESIKQINKAMQLNPLYAYEYLANLGWAFNTMGEYDKAIELIEESLARNENAILPRLLLASSYMGAGNQDEAEWQVDMILTNRPEMSLSLILKEFPFAEGEIKNQFIQRLRLAGLPE